MAGRGLNSCACSTDENGDSTGAYDPATGTIIPGSEWTNTPSDEWLANPGVSTVDNGLEIVPNTFGEEDSWDNISSFVALRWLVSDTTMLYGRIAEGFKGGGYEGISASGITFLGNTKFDEETALTYEFGVKSDFMNGRARMNLSAFYNDYNDLQAQILTPEFNAAGVQTDTVAFTTNVGDAEIYGVELEFTFLPFDGMTLSGSYGYLSTEIQDDVLVSVQTNPDVNDNYKGNELAKSPNNSFNVAADYEWALQSGATASLRVDYGWTDENWIAFNNYVKFPEQEFVDASFTFTTADQQWQFRVFGRNLTDEDILTNIGATGDHSERFGNFRLYEDLAAPRTVGVSVAWRYQ
jgi:iron complex outermembrane receptor protein